VKSKIFRLFSIFLIGVLLSGCTLTWEIRTERKGNLQGWVYVSKLNDVFTSSQSVNVESNELEELLAEGAEIIVSNQSLGNYLPVHGATVTLEHSRMGYTRTTQTNKYGRFIFNDILTGNVRVIIDAPGFAEPVVRYGTVIADQTSEVYKVQEGVNYYLFVGIDKYQYDGVGPDGETYSAKDARLMRNVLANNNTMSGRSKLLTDSGATKKNIKKEIESMVEKSNPEDTLVFYFSGHAREDIRYGGYGIPAFDHIIPYDGNDWDNDTIITDGELRDWFKKQKNYKGQRIIVILDANYSGTFMNEKATRVQPYALAEPGFTVLVSAKPDQPSFGDINFKHSVFTYYLAEGIRHLANKNPDGIVRVGELFKYVYEQMHNDWKEFRDKHGEDYADAVTSFPEFYGDEDAVIYRTK